MTSVRNHLRRLNGNNLLAVILFSLIISSCGTTGPKGPVAVDPNANQEKKVLVYNPETGEYEEVPVSQVVVDTVQLEDITDRSATPIGEKEMKILGEKKSAYHFSFLMPFNAIRYQNIGRAVDPKGRRFIQYYAGARLAIDDLMQEGIRINAHVFDTEESLSKLNSILEDQAVLESDLIVGPYRRAHIQAVSKFSSANQIPMVSPWIPGIELEQPNPLMVQMTPGLDAHAVAIFEHIARVQGDVTLYIVGRDKENESSRQELFQKAYTEAGLPPDSLHLLMIDDNTSDLQNTDWLSIFEKPNKAVFVLPYYSRSDESFVTSILRKIHAERLEKEVVVYGMPQWLGFGNLNFDYLKSLQTHVSSVSFTDRDHPKYEVFYNRFFDRYGIVPDDAAYQGYDLVYFFGKGIFEYGTAFVDYLDEMDISLMNMGVRFEPVYGSIPDNTNAQAPEYYVNKGIRILRFSDQAFRILRE